MRIAVCDDNADDLQQMCQLVTQYDKSICVHPFCTTQELYECPERFDAVLLDIEMQEAPNGLEIALRMSRQEGHPIILFVTNSAAYAIRGYGLALRYLLKPLTLDALTEALDAVKAELCRDRLVFTVDGYTHVLRAQQIRYAEVSGHRLTLHTDTGVLTLRATLKEICAMLPAGSFCAPHQSYLVNLLHVRSIAKETVLLDDGTQIPISRRRQAEFMDAFHTFLGVDVW